MSGAEPCGHSEAGEMGWWVRQLREREDLSVDPAESPCVPVAPVLELGQRITGTGRPRSGFSKKPVSREQGRS